MALPSCLLVSMGGRRSQRPRPSPTLESFGSSHQRRHKSRVSFRSSPCAHGVLGTPYEEVRETHPYQMESMPSLIILIPIHYLKIM